MHRHGYKGKKFGRERDQRRALLKGLADSLILHESIETTLPKAKELRPYTERLITKAKKGDLHNRRQVVSSLQTIESAHKLFDEIAPKLKGRSSGYLKIERTVLRRGDNAQLAKISFVDDLTSEVKPEKKEAPKPAKKPATTAKKTSIKKPATKAKKVVK
ncbi:50S ribosomal protein L17 [Candidatus Saccharibacteria bacterium]|nr:50S ribosomal protein L17 [Candidatus Saccharibacteria bacterium]